MVECIQLIFMTLLISLPYDDPHSSSHHAAIWSLGTGLMETHVTMMTSYTKKL